MIRSPLPLFDTSHITRDEERPPNSAVLERTLCAASPAPAWEARQGAEAALVSRGTAAPLSRSKTTFSPAVSGPQAAHLPPSSPQPQLRPRTAPKWGIPPTKGEHGRTHGSPFPPLMAPFPPPKHQKGEGKSAPLHPTHNCEVGPIWGPRSADSAVPVNDSGPLVTDTLLAGQQFARD